MIYRIILAVLALITPFLLYWLYGELARRSGRRRWPLAILFVVGAGLAVETFLVAALTRTRDTGANYAPARLEDGRVVREPGAQP